MVDPRLVSYISDGLKKGYTAPALRQYLLSQGYDQNTVDSAISAATGGSKTKFIVFILLLVLITGTFVGGAFYLMNKQFGGATESISDSEFGNFESSSSARSSSSNSRGTATGSSSRSSGTTTPRTVGTSSSTGSSSGSSSAPTTSQKISETFGFGSTKVTDFSSVRSVNDCDHYENERDQCILDFSWKKDHMSFCDKIDDSSVKDDCISQYALRHEDKELCDQIDNKYTREICVYFLLTTEKLKELNVAYSIDARTPEIIYDQDLALSNLENKVEANELEQVPAASTPGEGVAPTTPTVDTPEVDEGEIPIEDTAPAQEESQPEESGPTDYNPPAEEEEEENSGALEYNPDIEEEEEEEAIQYG